MLNLVVAVLVGLQSTSPLVQGRALQQQNTSGTVLRIANSGCNPHQVHVSLTGTSGEIRVSWKAHASDCDARVWYGPSDGVEISANSARIAEGKSRRLDTNEMCEPPATSNLVQLYLFEAILTQLDYDALHWYQFANGNRFTARSGPRTDASHRFSFLAFGDMGVGGVVKHKKGDDKCPGADEVLDSVIEEIRSGSASLVIHAGDISYADGNHDIWDEFMDAIEPVASMAPYMIAIGNHEYDYQQGHSRDPSGASGPYHPSWGNFGGESGGECGVMAAARFTMPDTRGKGNPPFWYSHDFGSVHFTYLSTEHDLTPGTQQHHWLKHDLSAVDRSLTPWSVVVMHRPMYVVYPHKSNRVVGEHLRGSLEALFASYGVDVVLSGHVHSYYRTCAVYDERCVGRVGGGIVHVVVGSGGHELSDVEHGQEKWCVGKARRFGYARIQVRGAEELTMQFVSTDDGGEVIDSVTLEGRDCQHCNGDLGKFNVTRGQEARAAFATL